MIMTTRTLHSAAAIAFALALAGCATTSPMLHHQVAAPAAWQEAAPREGTAVIDGWWLDFRSEELNTLIEQALAGSPDLAIAVERVRRAEAQARIAGASLFPSLDLGYGTSMRRVSDERGSATTEAASAVLSAAYEIDLWGRNRSGVQAAQAALRASTFDRDTARLTLIAGVATAYFDVLSLRNRLAIARENLAIAERVLEQVEARARHGAASALDVSRQDAAVLQQRAALFSIEQQERQTLAGLAVLTGRLPEGFEVKATGVGALVVPTIDPGLPAELIVRRPDLAGSEALLAAANANLAAARAALLPSISLTGSAGLASGALIAFMSGPASTVSLAMSLLQPIFDGGRRRGQVTIAESQERELVEAYRRAILGAFTDVENALGAAARAREQEALQERAVAQAREALRLAEIRYREGVEGLLTVLDAQRTLFSAEDQLAQTRLTRLQASVSLYRALGGGWSPEAVTHVKAAAPGGVVEL
jgi:outer membrane protein, multidrug efflux system